MCKCTNMGRSRCPRSDCSSTSFEAVALEPKHSNYRYMAIQCAECGAVVGVQDMYNTTVQLRALAASSVFRLKGECDERPGRQPSTLLPRAPSA
jgi:hypothetical protein